MDIEDKSSSSGSDNSNIVTPPSNPSGSNSKATPSCSSTATATQSVLPSSPCSLGNAVNSKILTTPAVRKIAKEKGTIV